MRLDAEQSADNLLLEGIRVQDCPEARFRFPTPQAGKEPETGNLTGTKPLNKVNSGPSFIVSAHILHATGDIRSVSLWLGHADVKTTEVYLRASPVEKLGILNANTALSIRAGTFPGARNSLMSLLNGN